MALEVDQIGLGAVPTPLESARGSQYGDSSNMINVDGAPCTKKRKRGRAGGKKHHKRHKTELACVPNAPAAMTAEKLGLRSP